MTSKGYGQWVSHGTYSLLIRVTIVLLGFLNVFFMVRIMPKQDIGVWVLFGSLTTILEMVRGGFIRNPLITHLVSAGEADKPSIINASLCLHCLLAIAISTLLFIGAKPVADFWDSPDLQTLLIIYAINNIVFIPFLHFEYLQTARLQFQAVFISNLVRIGILTVFIGLSFFLNLPFSLIDLAVVQLAATLLATVIAYRFVKDIIKFTRVVNRKMFSDLFHFGKFTFGTNMSSMLISSTDSWMIGRMMSTAAVAVYNPALKLANIFEVPTSAISNLIFPQVFSRMESQGKEGIRNIYTKSVGLMLALILPMVLPLYFFSEFFIVITFGKDYLEAADILKVTILSALIIPFNRQFGTVMDGLKKPQINFYFLVVAAVANVILNYFGLIYYGLIGCAYGTLISYCLLFTLNQIILYRNYKINAFASIGSVFDWYRKGWDFFFTRLLRAWRYVRMQL